MISNDKRIRIIIGHYGSGKSEFAMNYVTKLREEIDGKIALSDLDVVNVYFRTREKKNLLKSLNILPIDSSIDAPCTKVLFFVARKSGAERLFLLLQGRQSRAKRSNISRRCRKWEKIGLFWLAPSANREITTRPRTRRMIPTDWK